MKILVVTGPQGSGNHCWSKIFSKHTDVCGWEDLTKQYWVGHDKEPLFHCWHNPELLYEITWNHEYYFTKMSLLPLYITLFDIMFLLYQQQKKR